MNRTIKIAIVLTMLVMSISFAQNEISVIEQTNKSVTCDTLHRVISDSITADALLKSQKLYNESFANMQSSFSSFLYAVGIIIGILTLFTTILLMTNFRSVKTAEKEFREVKNDLSKAIVRVRNLEDNTNKTNVAITELQDLFKSIRGYK